ncbi:protein vac14 homolog [Plakobranchus ocellatus]|uniref:Protein vac14 homolog n=1 Tax=Plakobranchus ocellatus TaxID=259542 RepID=A0AAV4CKX2_9GAST|nr:protein vac14 homolog [Plakobranchus ocellatus]
MNRLVDWFKKDKQLLEDRGAFIIRQLSIYLSAEAIFRSLAQILTEASGVAMASTMVQCLNTILLTSTEIYELPSQLKELSSELVQLIESPIFAYLRLQLLEANDNPELIKSLYSLLMILPQSEAFKLLRYRLECISLIYLSVVSDNGPRKKNVEKNNLL